MGRAILVYAAAALLLFSIERRSASIHRLANMPPQGRIDLLADAPDQFFAICIFAQHSKNR
jgi:hypothetical protein